MLFFIVIGDKHYIDGSYVQGDMPKYVVSLQFRLGKVSS